MQSRIYTYGYSGVSRKHRYITWIINSIFIKSAHALYSLIECKVSSSTSQLVTDCELGRPHCFLQFCLTKQPISLATTRRAEVKMTEMTAAELTALDETVKVLRGSLDQMFLLVLGCCIFCEYQFSLNLHLTSLSNNSPVKQQQSYF